MDDFQELHPAVWQAKLIRQLRFLKPVAGWRRVVQSSLPADVSGAFRVANETGKFAGDLSSYIDRNLYLFGGYEDEKIAKFVSLVPPRQRTTILDIGTNVGTHAIAFSRSFAHVHAFEPSRLIWPSLDRNIALNDAKAITIHRYGLGERDSTIPFYTSAANPGMGTAVRDDGLSIRSEIHVRHGDGVVEGEAIGPVGAIKIDVQGFEPEVMRGLARTIERDRPILWVELNPHVQAGLSTRADLERMFGYPVRIYRFEPVKSFPFSRTVLHPFNETTLTTSDFVIVPASQDG